MNYFPGYPQDYRRMRVMMSLITAASMSILQFVD
jgi:hypothetical protein